MRLVYLHGFASSPRGTKATFFGARLAEHGYALEVPDLAPDFTHLTVTSMLAIVEPLVTGDTILLGSSLGGYLATLVAERHPEHVRGLVLFAPAFGFVQRWEEGMGLDAVARWRARGTVRCYHYGFGREVPLHIGLLDDGRGYSVQPDPLAPALVFAGERDEAVPLATIRPFVAVRPGRELVVFEHAGHELTEVLEPMWERTGRFVADIARRPAGG